MPISHPIAFCKTHGFFPATAIALAPGSKLNIQGCIQTCPQCGAPGEILSGVYQAGSDRLNVLLDPSISLQALGALRKLVERAQAGDITHDEAKKEAEKINPKVGRLFDVANWSDQARATLYAAIIGAVAYIAAAKITSSPTQTTVVNPTTVIEHFDPKPPKSPHVIRQRPTPRPKKHR